MTVRRKIALVLARTSREKSQQSARPLSIITRSRPRHSSRVSGDQQSINRTGACALFFFLCACKFSYHTQRRGFIWHTQLRHHSVYLLPRDKARFRVSRFVSARGCARSFCQRIKTKREGQRQRDLIFSFVIAKLLLVVRCSKEWKIANGKVVSRRLSKLWISFFFLRELLEQACLNSGVIMLYNAE